MFCRYCRNFPTHLRYALQGWTGLASVMDNGLAVAEKNGVAGGSALRRLALYVVKNRRTISVPHSPGRVRARNGVSKRHASRLEHCCNTALLPYIISGIAPPDLAPDHRYVRVNKRALYRVQIRNGSGHRLRLLRRRRR